MVGLRLSECWCCFRDSCCSSWAITGESTVALLTLGEALGFLESRIWIYCLAWLIGGSCVFFFSAGRELALMLTEALRSPIGWGFTDRWVRRSSEKISRCECCRCAPRFDYCDRVIDRASTSSYCCCRCAFGG